MATPRFKFPEGELDRWIVIGDVTEGSVRVWARDPSGPITAQLSIDGEVVASTKIETSPKHDHVGAAALTIDPAQPGVAFEVSAGGMTRQGRFAPAPGSRATFTFAFGSCHQPFTEALAGGFVAQHAGAAIYPTIGRLLSEREAAFALWLGDQVYSDGIANVDIRRRMAADSTITDADLLDTYRHLYRGYFNEAGYRRMAESLPAYLMWDDHDIFDGWGSLLDYSDFDHRVYRAAEIAYREYQHLRNPGGALDAEAPYGYSFWYGDVGFHVPDLRSGRDFHSGRVMADEGWDRLDAFLDEASRRGVPTVFLAISVPVVHASPALMRSLERIRLSFGRDVRDRWSVTNFAPERTKLLERIFAWQSAAECRQVIVLSGDVHVGAAFTVKPRHGHGRFRQWTSSALSTPDGLKHVLANRLITKYVRLGEQELRVWRRGLATSNNVGLVSVEPAVDGGHLVRLDVYEYDAHGDSLAVGLSDVARPSKSV